MYNQQEEELCFTFVTMAAGQKVLPQIPHTIFEASDMRVYRNNVECTYHTAPTTKMQFKLTFVPGVQNITVEFGAVGTTGDKVVTECDVEAYRMLQMPVAGPLPMYALNDEQNFYARAIQSAARWQELLSSFLRTAPGTTNPIIGYPDGGCPNGEAAVLVINADGSIGLTCMSDVAPGAGGETPGGGGPGGGGWTDAEWIAIFMRVVSGFNLWITQPDDDSILLQPDLGGDLRLLEGDQQSGVGGGGGTPLAEVVEDMVADILVAGDNITISHDDVANTITIEGADQSGGGGPEQNPLEAWVIPICADGTVLTNGMTRTFRAPYAATVVSASASLKTAQTSGAIVRFDVKETGGSIFGANKLTLDNGETTTATAATPADLSDLALASNAELVFSCDQVGDGTAKGGVVTLTVRRA